MRFFAAAQLHQDSTNSSAMHFSIVFLAIVSTSLASPSHPDLAAWNSFKLAHNKVYDAEEERIRFQIFSENLKSINEHNALHSSGLTTYKKAVNRFADLTDEEFRNYLALSGSNPILKIGALGIHEAVLGLELPQNVDYRMKNAVNPVKDQGSCGSCWAFSTVAALESINFLQKGELLSLSEQNLVDCSSQYGNAGCDGGLMEAGFTYIRDYGIETEATYPYKAYDGTCRFDRNKSVLNIKGYKSVAEGSEAALQSAVATVGPTSVSVDASEMRFYHSGVFKASNPEYSLNHGIVAVGYGSENGQDYWIVRNSWGPTWGEDGYIRIARNDGNQVGIADMASYPVL